MQMRIIKKKEYVYLIGSVTTHIILYDKHIFSTVILHKANLHTISGPIKIIDFFGNATIVLPNGTTLHIEDVLLSNRLN